MEIETTKMSTRGQVIIPRDIREYIEADKDTIFAVMPINKETIVMKKINNNLIEEFKKIRSEINKINERDISNEIKEYRKSRS
ncbi:MAG: hypothetical protein QXR96_02005 [Candidatus Woesearchaeota archaeon]